MNLLMKLFRFFQINKEYLSSIPRSLYFNIKFLGWKKGICCPLFISNNTHVNDSTGKIIIESPLQTGMVKIGYPTSDVYCSKDRSILSIAGEVLIKNYANIGAGTRLSVGKNSVLIIGSHLWITGGCLIIVRKKLEFKANSVLSWGITIMDHDAHKIMYEGVVSNEPSPVLIGSHTWIGFNSIILKGSSIPDNSIVAAGTIITKKFTNPNTVICGMPGMEKKKNISWE